MHNKWQLQEAKNGFRQLIREAADGEPQLVTVRGKPAAVVVSVEEYTRLTKRHKGKLSAALLRPDIGSKDVDFARDREDFCFSPQVFDRRQL